MLVNIIKMSLLPKTLLNATSNEDQTLEILSKNNPMGNPAQECLRL